MSIKQICKADECDLILSKEKNKDENKNFDKMLKRMIVKMRKNEFKRKSKEYYNKIDNDKTIPKIEIGMKFVGKKTGKIYEVYFNEEEQRIAMKRIGKGIHFLDCHLDMFEWDMLEKINQTK